MYSPEKMLDSNDKCFLHVKCLDGHNIRTNIRANLCRDGTEDLWKEAWVKVAESGGTPLTLALLEQNRDGKILDQQSDPYVRTVFCGAVEEELYKLGFIKEAIFTKLLREWHHAEDMAGILAVERCRRVMQLRKWLLESVSFAEFPPPGSHIKGFPRVTFEGSICNIEAHLYMYALAKSGTYNWRSLSTLVAENVFDEISEMESSRNGVPTGDSFQRDMTVMAGLHAVRLKPDRQFYMQTAKSRTYPIPHLKDQKYTCDEIDLDSESVQHISKVIPRDHIFDTRPYKHSRVVLGSVRTPFEAPKGCKACKKSLQS